MEEMFGAVGSSTMIVQSARSSSIDLQKGQELPLENGSVIRIPTRVKEAFTITSASVALSES
eukprot:5212798-Amphidinium_carterae.1